MYFSINAFKHFLGLGDTYRLQKDNKWEVVSSFKSFNTNSDKLFLSYEDAQYWLDTTGKTIINGEHVNTIPKQVNDLFPDEFEFEIIAHRLSKPQHALFTRELLKSVLVNGNDETTNTLVLDFDGAIKLVQGSYASIKGFPVRLEPFHAGNGYVGAMSETNHLEQFYMMLLEGWDLHLSSGRSIYIEYLEGKQSEEELVQKINNQLSTFN